MGGSEKLIEEKKEKMTAKKEHHQEKNTEPSTALQNQHEHDFLKEEHHDSLPNLDW